ncbi:MAG: oxidoreductase [Desulfatitalea sp.]|nr:oxidoreductase [Desulfatitalea sp.]
MDSPAKRPDSYLGLKSLSDQAFPKRCPRCGRLFSTAAEFIHGTQAVRTGNSGLKSVRDETDRPMVELFRNCPCGSTLMDRFDDRRDLSTPGLRRRKLFGQLLHLLENRGVATELARAELLKLLRGEPSAILAGLGIGCEDLH